MLAALTVRDIVLIENGALEFAPGLNVLTGETGAGKSILLDALGLAVGLRGRAALRAGAAQGAATAVFEPAPGHPSRALLEAQAMPDEGEIVLRRTLGADGRTRAFVNDQAVGVGLLKELGGLLLEVHGQADDRGLFDTATHRALLDAYGGHGGLLEEVGLRHAAFASARQMLEALRARAAAATADADYVRGAVDELSAFAAGPGEEAALAAERALLMNAARVAEDIAQAQEALAGERGAEATLATALGKLSRMNPAGRAAASSAESALEQALALTEEARRDLDALLSRLEPDSGLLERMEERLFALRALARKYQVAPDALGEVLAEFRARRDALENGGVALKDAEAAVEKARAAYLDAATRLSKARGLAARRLEAAVGAEFAPLKLGNARFRVALEPLADDIGSPAGLERVKFEIATMAGAEFGPLTKIASGGELARFSLALKVALAQVSPPAALVFDEVDRGVGGAVADAVGERLQRLARTTQVLLVTHSPQVAARAARHFRITRHGDRTRIDLLSDEARVEEIARMLSGASVTDEARAAAARLIEAAGPNADDGPKKSRKRA